MAYKPRTTTPSKTNKCYYKNNPFHQSGYGLPNCTCYAFGRFSEVMGKIANLSLSNAENWWAHKDGYSRGQTPRVGAVICWRKGQAGNGSDGAGHVAIVEKVYSNGKILIGQSGWGASKKFWTQTLSPPYEIGGTYKLQGFIYNPAVPAPKYTVYLSPSNHGVGANKCLKDGCYEDKHTRPIAEACAKYLRSSGVIPIIASKSTSMAQRCVNSDKAGAVLHVPIHTNAASDKSVRYLMLMFAGNGSEYKKIFNSVSPYLEAIYPNKKDAVFDVRTDLYEIKHPRAKTMYCELGFHTNKTDVEKFIHKSDAVGKALAKGICKYLGVKFKEVNDETKIVKKPTTTTKKVYSGTFPTLPKRGYFIKGDEGKNVEYLQKFLNWAIGTSLKIDGKLGDLTLAAIETFQEKYDLKVDGKFGKKCLAKAKTIKK